MGRSEPKESISLGSVERPPTTENHSATSSIKDKRPRRADFDNVRSFLTAWVIIHHTAVAYGGQGSWKFRSRCFPPLSLPLSAFTAVGQTFGMATFFFLSGRFSGSSISKSESVWLFVRSKMLRLLLPAVLYTFFIDPLVDIIVAFLGLYSDPPELTLLRLIDLSKSIYRRSWINVHGIRGPVWYTVLLTIFDSTAILSLPMGVHYTRGILSRSQPFFPTLSGITVAILSSFAICLTYPIGKTVVLLNLQPAFLPQYILAYILGLTSQATQNPFAYFPLSHATTRRPIAVFPFFLTVSTLTLGLLARTAKSLAPVEDDETAVQSFKGGMNIPALLYAIWNEASFAFITPALLAVFREYFDTPWTIRLKRPSIRTKAISVARYSYASFLVHPVVSVTVEVFLDRLMGCGTSKVIPVGETIGAFWTAMGVGMLNVLACSIVAYGLVQYVPLARRLI